MKPRLEEHDFESAALDLGVPVATVKAVTEIESRGAGFLPDGHPVVLFERHIMYRRVRDKFGLDRAKALAARYPDIINSTAGGYGKTSEQPKRMGRAADLIDRECALESASWGMFQVMGFHWEWLGYPSLQSFVNAMYRSEREHLDSFVRYVKKTPAALRGLRERDWAAFARAYNGPAYAQNKYDIKLAAAYARHSTA